MATAGKYGVSVNGNVTVNNGSLACPAGGGRQVLVTPLSQQRGPASQQGIGAGRLLVNSFPAQSSQQQQPRTLVPNPNCVLPKVLLKAHSLNKKDPAKTFTLRNLDLSVIKSCADLKAVIKRRLSSDITAGEYDVGYIQGSNVVRVRTPDDLDELWALLRNQQKNVAIWCDGLEGDADTASASAATRGRKRKKPTEAPEVASKKPVDTHERVQTLVDELKDKHTTKYTPMQYRIWGELIVGGQHVSMEEAPDNNSMFNQAGGGNKGKPKDVQSPVAQALTEAATVLTSALTPKLPAARSRNSPAKLIENRSSLYKQLQELQALKGAGILTEEEYTGEKAAIMDMLRQLNSK